MLWRCLQGIVFGVCVYNRFSNPFNSMCLERAWIKDRAEDEYQIPSSHPVCITQPPVCISVRIPNRYTHTKFLPQTKTTPCCPYLEQSTMHTAVNTSNSLHITGSNSLTAHFFQTMEIKSSCCVHYIKKDVLYFKPSLYGNAAQPLLDLLPGYSERIIH